MEYTKTYNNLKLLFDPEKSEIIIPDSGIRIKNIRFRSDFPSETFLNANDTIIPENIAFSYPVFTPADLRSDKVIILLHGLNERSWVKYLVWAYWLAEFTGSYIILFPISFHINRSPSAWKDPRVMIPFLKERNSTLGQINMSSFANVAISQRLADDPLRFFNAGYQTETDITKLLLSVRQGLHPVIPQSKRINIFAYSIGAFLAQIILMGNPENLFAESKLFIFCGGSVFSNMQGSSRLIMDSNAFDKVYNFYLNDFEKDIELKNPLRDFLNTSQIGMAFRSMIDLGRFKSFRENILKNLSGRIKTITLAKDRIIPAEGVVATLNTTKNRTVARIWDFPYNYTHENPFPVFNGPETNEVDRCFDRVFMEAKKFLD